MKINIKDIFDFYNSRIACHVESVNYFADILGYHFPEHDGDKIVEPMRTGYAYIFYKSYHKNFKLSKEYIKLCNEAKQTHYKHATHHIQHYKSVQDIPDVHIYEMVSDWASANFEQKDIIGDKDAVSLREWFDKNMAKHNWTKHQLDIIQKSIDIIDKQTDTNKVKAIWQDLLGKSEL